MKKVFLVFSLGICSIVLWMGATAVDQWNTMTASGDLTGTYPGPALVTTGVVAGTYDKYVVDSKGRITQGLMANAMSTDRGDNSVTLTVGSDSPIQVFSTALTGAKTITLSTVGAVNGSKFRIVRSGLGVGTLAVGGLITLPTLLATWTEVVFNGSAWVVTGYGLLTP